MLAARAFAVIAGRDYVTPEDVKVVAQPVLAHRITVKPEMWMSQASRANRRRVRAVIGSDPVAAGVDLAGANPAGAELGRTVTTGTANSWRPTVAYFRAAVGAMTMIAFALIWRRPDLLVIATPLAVVTAWSLLTRPGASPDFVDGVGHPTIREGDATTWHGAISGVAELDLVVAALERCAVDRNRPGRQASSRPARSTARRTSRSECVRHGGGLDRSSPCTCRPPHRGPHSAGRPSRRDTP